MTRVGRADAVAPGGALAFSLEGRACMLVRAPGGELRAYLNVCAHHARPLDAATGGFWAEDAAVLECGEHGARYDPLSGVCVAGPCEGAALDPVRIEVRAGEVWAELPLDED
jgi:nitrite reductase/ring-hydroxylating ferredoxin subunit